jgi:hypothetical protein
MSGPASLGIYIDKLPATTCPLYIPDYGTWDIILFIFID